MDNFPSNSENAQQNKTKKPTFQDLRSKAKAFLRGRSVEMRTCTKKGKNLKRLFFFFCTGSVCVCVHTRMDAHLCLVCDVSVFLDCSPSDLSLEPRTQVYYWACSRSTQSPPPKHWGGLPGLSMGARDPNSGRTQSRLPSPQPPTSDTA